MDRRENISSQIYLLSLDTFMIMTVMGITLGIIFFILNPTLNYGLTIKVKQLEFQIGERKYNRVKNVIFNNYNKDIGEEEFLDIKMENGNLIEITLNNSSSVTKPFKYTFRLYDNDSNLIEISSAITQAIQSIGLSFILQDKI